MLLGYTVAKACVNQRNLTWFTGPFPCERVESEEETTPYHTDIGMYMYQHVARNVHI